MKKILLSIIMLISVTMLFFAFSTSASAETYGELTYEVKDGEVTITDCDDSVTEVDIPSEINGCSVTRIGDSAFANCTQLTEVTIPVTVINMDVSAFAGCDNLDIVNIESIEAWLNISFEPCLISDQAPDNYYSCYSNPLSCGAKLYLKNELVEILDIPDSITRVNDYAFYNFKGLKEVILGDNIKSIGESAFSACSDLENISLCDSLSFVDKFAFYGCPLKKVNIESIESWLKIEYRGEGNTGYPECSHPLIVSDAELLLNNQPIVELVIPEGITSIGTNSFKGCSSLTQVTFHDSVSYIGSFAFCGCDNLTSIVLPESLTSINIGIFENCPNLRTITIPATVKFIDYRMIDGYGYQDILFKGTPEQWNEIYFGDEDRFSTFGESFIHYNVGDETHERVVIKGKEPTCTETGLSDSIICSGCDIVFEKHQEIPMKSHNYDLSGIVTPPTCIHNGYTTYTCRDCNNKYTGDYVNPTGIHTEEIVPGTPATCTQEGITSSKKCSVCNLILLYPSAIPAKDHTPGPWTIVIDAQVGEDGLELQECTVCYMVLNERNIPALSEEKKPDAIVGDANGDGKITAADARITLRISAKLEKIESYKRPLSVFDATGDNKITAADARKILRVSAKLESM